MADRLLVMRGGALGDFILGLPALSALRRAFPRATLDLIAPAAVLPLARPLVDVATPLERAEVASLFAGAGQLPEDVIARYRDLDLVVLWLSDPDGSVRRTFQDLAARRVLHAPALPTEPGLHATDHLLNTLKPLGIRGVPAVPVVSPGAGAEGAPVGNGGVPLVAIHPGSGGRWKTWPPERFARVADRLTAQGRRVALIQGPADDEVVARVLAAVAGEPPDVVAGLSVEELVAFLAACSCYVGNDSGVTHLAAAVGTPTVAIFGPTDPAMWGPRGRRVAILRGEQGCAPCSREAALHCEMRACLEGVGVEQVVEALAGILGGTRM